MNHNHWLKCPNVRFKTALWNFIGPMFDVSENKTKTTPLRNISGRLLVANILLRGYSEIFWKIPKKTSVRKSCFNNIEDSRRETLVKYNLTKDVFLQTISHKKFLLKSFGRLTFGWNLLFYKKESTKSSQQFDAKRMRNELVISNSTQPRTGWKVLWLLQRHWFLLMKSF